MFIQYISVIEINSVSTWKTVYTEFQIIFVLQRILRVVGKRFRRLMTISKCNLTLYGKTCRRNSKFISHNFTLKIHRGMTNVKPIINILLKI